MDFQSRLHADALALLRDSGFEPVSTVIAADVRVGFADFELWIYGDGANLVGPSTDKRFEIYDYAADFLAAVEAVVIAKRCSPVAAMTEVRRRNPDLFKAYQEA